MVVPHCLMWCIWKERNGRCFEDIEHSMPDIKLLFFRTLLDWFSVWRNHPFSSILDLLDFYNVRSWFVHPCIPPMYLGVSLFLISMNLCYLSKKIKKIIVTLEMQKLWPKTSIRKKKRWLAQEGGNTSCILLGINESPIYFLLAINY